MSTSVSSLSKALDALHVSKTIPSPSQNDLKLVLATFSDLTASRSDISKAYAYLARLLLPSPESKQADRKDEHVYQMSKIVTDWLKSDYSQIADQGKAFGALSAILQVDVSTFSSMLQMDDMSEKVVSAAEIVMAEHQISEMDIQQAAQRSLALLLSQAAGYSNTRTLARTIIASANIRWQQCEDRPPEGNAFKAAIAVTLTKLSLAQAAPTSVDAGQSLQLPDAAALLDYFAKEATNTDTQAEVLPLIMEGLAILSMQVAVRRSIMSNAALLTRFWSLAGHMERNELQYGLATIFSLLTAYYRRQSEDDGVKDRLRKYANAGGQSEAEIDKPEPDREIDARNTTLVNSGIMQACNALSKASSNAVRQLAAKTILNLVDKREMRGLVVQQGGAKALLTIIRQSGAKVEPEDIEQEDLVAIQALAKLLITANPATVLGPPSDSPMINAAYALSIPLLATSSTLLQEFESLMALTNLAGLSEELQERIARVPKLLRRLDDILLEGGSSEKSGQHMCRRAAMELVCNLVSCDTAFVHYTAIDQLEKLQGKSLPAPMASRLRLLIALANAEDIATRQAALGALATLTLAPTICSFVCNEEKRISIFFEALVDPDIGAQLRGIECIKNLAKHTDSIRERAVGALSDLRKSEVADVQASATEALQEISILSSDGPHR